MHISTAVALSIFIIVLAYESAEISGNPIAVKSAAKVAAVNKTITTHSKNPAVDKAPTSPAKGGKKTKSKWVTPNAAQKKIFTDYKALILKKLRERQPNVPATYKLEPVKTGSHVVKKVSVNHYLIKLPDKKYAHAIVAVPKTGKKEITEHNVSVRRTIFDTLEAAEEQ